MPDDVLCGQLHASAMSPFCSIVSASTAMRMRCLNHLPSEMLTISMATRAAGFQEVMGLLLLQDQRAMLMSVCTIGQQHGKLICQWQQSEAGMHPAVH